MTSLCGNWFVKTHCAFERLTGMDSNPNTLPSRFDPFMPSVLACHCVSRVVCICDLRESSIEDEFAQFMSEQCLMKEHKAFRKGRVTWEVLMSSEIEDIRGMCDEIAMGAMTKSRFVHALKLRRKDFVVATEGVEGTRGMVEVNVLNGTFHE